MKTILLVAHEPIIRSVLKLELADRYDLLEAVSPVQALDICRARHIDLLICDVAPGLVSGMELASLLRAWFPRLRTILTTDVPHEYWSERQQAELRELPEEEVVVLERPFVSSDLKALLAELMPADVAASSAA